MLFYLIDIVSGLWIGKPKKPDKKPDILLLKTRQVPPRTKATHNTHNTQKLGLRLRAAKKMQHEMRIGQGATWMEKWVFVRTDGSGLTLWDSGVRQAMKRAAAAEGWDFPVLARTPSDAPISRGGKRGVGRASRRQKSPATARSG